MKWAEFIKGRNIYAQVWKNLKKDFSADVPEFYGTFYKNRFSGHEFNEDEVIKELIEKHWLEAVPPLEFRLIQNIGSLFRELRGLFPVNYKKVYFVLRHSHVKYFLKSSYLEIFYKSKQMPFSANDPFVIATSNPDFFIEDEYSRLLLELVEDHKKFSKKEKENGKGKESAEFKEILKEIKEFDAQKLSIIEHRVDIIFPTVDIYFIQLLKKSRWVDQKLVDMSKASIRVYLKKDLNI